MRRSVAFVAVAAALALAGCSGPIPSPPLPKPLTDDEVAAILETDANIRWSTLETLVDGAPRPDAEFIAFATPDTWPTVMADCMRNSGIESAHVRDDGGLTYRGDGPGERIVFYGCSIAYPVDPRAEGYLSEEQRGYAWDYWTSRTVPCLLGLGYPVPGVPERRDFIRRSYAGTSWSPYLLILDDETGQEPPWSDIDAQCPPLTDPFPVFH